MRCLSTGLCACVIRGSANRGACGQPCRLAWDLVTATGKPLIKNSHLLSFKDMNRSGFIEDLVRAGISSLKIEGRLKDLAYFKNVTGFYRQHLDAFLEANPRYAKGLPVW